MELTDEGTIIAKALWQEMLDEGYGEADEVVSDEILYLFITNQDRDFSEYCNQAATGDVSAIAQLRTWCGLRVL